MLKYVEYEWTLYMGPGYMVPVPPGPQWYGPPGRLLPRLPPQMVVPPPPVAQHPVT